MRRILGRLDHDAPEIEPGRKSAALGEDRKGGVEAGGIGLEQIHRGLDREGEAARPYRSEGVTSNSRRCSSSAYQSVMPAM